MRKHKLYKMVKVSLIIFTLLGSETLYAKYLTNKDWVKKENLTSPISININGKSLDLDRDIDKILTYYNNKPFDYFFLPDKKKINDRQKECARNLKKNIYRLRSQDKPVVLPYNLTWTENPFNDRNWQFWFHNWVFTDCLLDGYISFKDPWYLQRMKWLVSDWWIDNFKEEFPSKEFSWYDHTIPKRVEHMLEIFEFLRRNNALDNDFTKVALRSLYWHARILAEEKPLYLKNHNHGLDQSMKLFEISQLFPEFSLSPSWEEISKKRLKNEIDFALTTEGVHKENSPDYHSWISVYCAKINNFSKYYTGNPITRTDNKELQNSGLKFVSTISRPDKTLPQLGDTLPNRNINIHYPLQEELSWYPYYQYIKLDGKIRKNTRETRAIFKESGYFIYHRDIWDNPYIKLDAKIGKKPQETTAIFKESGYFIYRDKWDYPGENSAMHLILKCGFLSKTHRHNDDGNILLYGLGEDWLIDAGMHGFEKNKYRSYAVSPSAHNISFPYSTKLSSPSASKKITTLDERFSKYKNHWGIVESSNTHALCESKMFRGYTYKRRLEILGERSFRLNDQLIPEKTNSQDVFMTVFKFPDNKTIYINRKKQIIMAVNSTLTAGLKIHYNNSAQDIKLFRGEEGEIFSFETIGYLEMRPAQTITFINKSESYSADFKLELVSLPTIKNFEKMSKAGVNIQNNDDSILFTVSPNTFSIKQDKANLQIAFYLYKDDNRVDTKMYSKNFSYKLDKQKYGKGIYRIRYFLVNENEKYPDKAAKTGLGYSEYIEIK